MTSSCHSPRKTRWWEYAREGRLFCGPEPKGHHIPARFEIPESGLVQCGAPALPQILLDLKRARESRQFREADRLEAELRRAGMVDVPDIDELRRMAHDAPACAQWVFVYAIRGSGIITAHVDPAERKEMRKLSTPAEVIEYLGIFPTR